jgi:hypothetical protein
MNIVNQPLTHNVTLAIDEIGRVDARIADLKKTRDNLADIIKSLGAGSYDGELFRATVSVSDRETLDMKAVREKLSPQFISAHTNVTTVVALRVVGRK